MLFTEEILDLAQNSRFLLNRITAVSFNATIHCDNDAGRTTEILSFTRNAAIVNTPVNINRGYAQPNLLPAHKLGYFSWGEEITENETLMVAPCQLHFKHLNRSLFLFHFKENSKNAVLRR